MERSRVTLRKWVLAAQLMASSKKGMSALQLQRMIGTDYETAWFLFHRLPECAIDPKRGPIIGENKVVDVDEFYVGGKARNGQKGKPVPKNTPLFHWLSVTAKCPTYPPKSCAPLLSNTRTGHRVL